MTTSLSCSHVVCFICNNEICQIGRKYSLEINLKIYKLLNVYSDSTVNETIQICFTKAKHRIFLSLWKWHYFTTEAGWALSLVRFLSRLHDTY